MTENFKTIAINSFIWKFAEQCVASGAQLIIGIILARLLFPEDYSIIIIATVFIGIATVFIDSGFSTALIQRKEITDADTSSIFYLSLIVSVFLYGVLFIIAPFIADIYNEPVLCPVLRVLGLTLIIGVVSSIQKVFISRNFQFKKQFIVSLASAIVSGIFGIIIAYLGYGVWALVVQQLCASLLSTLILIVLINWKPKLIFSATHAKSLFSFGWKILVSQLIYKIYYSIRSLTIGAFYSKSDLAYYTKGEEYPQYLINAIDGTVQAVLFPAYAKYQDDKIVLKSMLRNAMKMNAFITFPAMFGLAAVAEPLVSLILTDKWILCVPFLQIFCLNYALQPISSANLAAIKAVGRADIFLRLEIIKTIFLYMCLLCSLPFGVLAIAVSTVVSKIFAVIINIVPNRTLLNYTHMEMLQDIGPILLLSSVMAIIVSSINYFNLSNSITLCIQIPLGIIIYLFLTKLFHINTYNIIMSNLKKYLIEISKK